MQHSCYIPCGPSWKYFREMWEWTSQPRGNSYLQRVTLTKNSVLIILGIGAIILCCFHSIDSVSKNPNTRHALIDLELDAKRMLSKKYHLETRYEKVLRTIYVSLQNNSICYSVYKIFSNNKWIIFTNWIYKRICKIEIGMQCNWKKIYYNPF